ncbi:MAG: hypothetical protein RL065_1727 [Bacteroidota bacterium]|jgi:hypothetical protein
MIKAIINQLFEIETKLKLENLDGKFERNFNRIKQTIEAEGYTYHNPVGEKYAETRTDCEASISGGLGSNLKITQVIKPIIHKHENGNSTIVQKGIVIVENI